MQHFHDDPARAITESVYQVDMQCLYEDFEARQLR
jgi:hypothetical protein